MAPSTFLQRQEARRSLHPTHSVAGIGPMISALAKGHEDSVTPCGPDSPYYRLAELGGYVLLIGVGQDSNTTIHTCEELAEVPYHLQTQPTDAVIIDYGGRRHIMRLVLHDWGTPRQFDRLDDELLRRGIMQVGRVGNATLRLIRSVAMIEWLVDVLKKKPRYLISD